MTLFACIFLLGNRAYAFTSTNYYNSQSIRIGLESMRCDQLNITLNGDYTLNGALKNSGTSYILKASGSKILLNGVPQSNLSFIPINTKNTIKIVSNYNRNYRGTLTFKISSSKVLPVNTLYIEDYLKGVVGKEMPNSYPIEALKAQAVAARNYALINMSKHSGNAYSLCDTTDCQVYGGYDASLTKVIAAVDVTKGKILLSGTSLVRAYFSASDGGFTEACENVWMQTVGYLKTKQDNYDVSYLWNSKYTTTTINTLLKIKTSLKIPVDYTFVRINLTSITKFPSGRIKNISSIFRDRCGVYHTISYSKDNARMFLNLNSAMYNVSYNSALDMYTFNGKGVGHGVGMSQIGANHRATAGQSYDTILKFYYNGTKILTSVVNYRVTFNSQGGKAVSSKIVSYNDTITTPAMPTKIGYTFAGWYKQATCLNQWNFANNSVTANTILYAKWGVNKYTVSFNSQGGKVVSNKIANYNSAITNPATPTKTNYTFGGWYKQATCVTAWNFKTNKVTNNTTLYAKWTVAVSIGAPSGLKVLLYSYNSIAIKFNAVAGASGYEVFRATSSNGTYSLLSRLTNTNYTNYGITTGRTYYYKIRSYRNVGSTRVYYSHWSAIVHAKA